MYTHFIIILKNISFLYYLILTAIALSLYTENEMKKIKKNYIIRSGLHFYSNYTIKTLLKHKNTKFYVYDGIVLLFFVYYL